MNVGERVVVVERNKEGFSLPSPSVLWIVVPVKENPDIKRTLAIFQKRQCTLFACNDVMIIGSKDHLKVDQNHVGMVTLGLVK